MDDVKQKIQSKVKELYKLDQEFRSEYPELINNYWFNAILDRIKSCIADNFGESFEPDGDLKQIDQAASFFNIDYDLHCEYQHGLLGSLSFCVIFDFSKPYNQQKAIKEQQAIVENNSQLSSKWSDISDTLIVGGLSAFIASFSLAIANAGSIAVLTMLGIGLTILFAGIIGHLVNNNRIKKAFVSIASKLQQIKTSRKEN